MSQGRWNFLTALVPEWWTSPYRSLGRCLVVGFALPLLVVAIGASRGGDAIEAAISTPVDFQAAQWFGRTPKADDRLKIFAFDDPTVNFAHGTELTYADWIKIFSALSAAEPKQIFVDKVFGLVPPGEDAPAFVAALQSLPTPIIVGAFAAPNEIQGRPSLNPGAEQGGHARVPESSLTARLLVVDRGPRPIAYGPAPEILPAFARVGHLTVLEGGFTVPTIALGDGRSLPHLSFYAAPDLSVAPGNVLVGGEAVPVDRVGRLPINFIDPIDFSKRVYSMKALISRARGLKPISVVNPGDIVVVLPMTYTGGTDFFETPFGLMPGGYLIVSLINSALRGAYLRPLTTPSIAILLFALVGMAVGAYCGARSFWTLLTIMAVLDVVGGIAAFSVCGILLPWAQCAFSTILVAVAVYAERGRIDNLKKVRLDAELETASAVQHAFVPPSNVDEPLMQMAAFYQSASECGGDWWHHFSIADRRYLFVADVTGHGVSAALITAMGHASIEGFRQRVVADGGAPPNPQEFIKSLNQLLFETGKGTMTMSIVVMAMDLGRRELLVANNGMRFPTILPATAADRRINSRRSSGENACIVIRTAGNMLGMDPTVGVNERCFRLAPGDRLLVFSDGLIEGIDPHRQPWGMRKLLKTSSPGRDLSARDLRDRIIYSYQQHTKMAAPIDDVTLVVVAFGDLAEQPEATDLNSLFVTAAEVPDADPSGGVDPANRPERRQSA